jgi:hypothetical protein
MELTNDAAAGGKARMAQTERRRVETWQVKSKLNEESSSIPSISFSG